jgi:GH18 family chitinase
MTPTIASASSGAPVIFFTDLTSGPATGGENGGGAFVTLYGNNFGTNPTVTVGGAVATIKSAPTPYLWYQRMTIQIPSTVPNGATSIQIGGGNSVPFTVRAGTITIVTSASALKSARTTWKAGDIIYAQGAWAVTGDDGLGWRSSFDINSNFQHFASGTTGAPIAIVGYPGSNVTIGGGADFGLRMNDGATNYVFANLTFRGGQIAASVTGSDIRFVGSDISAPTTHQQSGCWIVMGGDNVKFLGNNVHNCGTSASDKQDHAVYIGTDTNHVEEAWNSIHDNLACYGTQVHSSPLGTGTGYNQYDLHIHDNQFYNQVCSAFNFASIDPSKGTVEFYDNLVYNAGTSAASDGGGGVGCLYLAGITNTGSSGGGSVQIYNNTFYKCGPVAILDYDGAHPIVLRNNIIQTSGAYLWTNYLGSGATLAAGVSGSNNLYFGAGTAPSQTAGNLNVDPKFTNPGANDFSLQSGSPAIGAGTSLSLASDIIGTPRSTSLSLGAYEPASSGGTTTVCIPPVVASGCTATLTNATTCTYTTVCANTADTVAPSVPTNLSATAISTSQINLTWTASTDNVGVTGYKIYRGGTQIGTATTNSYQNTGLSPATNYSYTVSAYDLANNNSAQSGSVSATTQAVLVTSSGPWITGYYETWLNGVLPVTSIPLSKYTHIIATFFGQNSDCTVSTQTTEGEMQTLITNAHANNVKVLFSTGDQISGNNYMSTCTDSAHLNTFVNNLITYMNGTSGRTASFDGIDLDWEGSNINSQYVNLINALRSALPAGKLLTTAMGNFSGLPSVAAQTYSKLDQINLMNYDQDGDLSQGAWFNNSLYQAGDTSKMTSDWNARAFTSVGVPSVKLGMGIPFYGRRWTGVTLPQQIGGTKVSTVNYNSLIADTTRWQDVYKKLDSVHYGQYLSIPSLNEFVSYSDQVSIKETVKWGKTQGFGGYMTYSLPLEYLANQSSTETRSPLSTELWNDVNGITTNVCTPPIVASGCTATLTNATTCTYTTVCASTKFTAGQRVQTTANLNVRATPSSTGTLLGTQSSGALGTIVSGPTNAGGYNWWNVNFDSGVDGYSAEDFLITYTAPICTPPIVASGCTATLTNATTCTYTTVCANTADTVAPSVPTNLSATAISSSQINLTWTASTDNVGVTGYKVFRNGIQVGTATTNSYSDSNLSSITTYSYTVSAYDAAGNNSAQSTSATGTTQPVVVVNTCTPPPVAFGCTATLTDQTTCTYSTVCASGKFTVGQQVQTTARVNVRSKPSALATRLGRQATGAVGTIVSCNSYIIS